ncbi:MAG TPA: putative selenium-dependent hydroxylase accessory protein YqeC [Desulfuromonadales bacterium]|nr:putative selenium-dependent hydroxylase accessory protein YqeC [Desulfuromonadales bacterium]
MSDCCYSLEQILCGEPHGIVSFVGAGGKTSLLFHLAHQLACSGKRVLTTTTTKIFVPTPDQSHTVIIDADPEAVIARTSALLSEAGHITAAAARMAESGKLQGFAPEAISVLQKSGLFDWILVEADGAARRSLKAPADHEPVIPAETSVLVAVAGLDLIGEPLSEQLVFRSTRAGDIMGLNIGETITEPSLARLFAHPLGSFKGAPPQSRRFIFLNKADSSKRRYCGEKVAQLLSRMASPPVEAVIVGQALGVLRIHALHHVMVQT